MTRPNVVVIYADDLGYGDLGCFGADEMQTPNLDALADTGVRMTDWYSNSPVCSPSRASLLTGKYPARAGVRSILGGARNTHGLRPQPTIASLLHERGYRTGIFGKWHLGVESSYRPQAFGFEKHVGFLAGCVDYYSHIFYWGDGHNPVHDLWRDDSEIWDNGKYLTHLITDTAVDFIREKSGEEFFCFVAYNAPHYPMHAPREYLDRFPDLPADRRIFAAMVAALDDGVGRIVHALEEAGIRDNTIIFFSSDNGPSAEQRNWLNGEEVSYTGGSAGGLRGNKGSVFEGGIRVPAIMSWPAGLPQGRVVDHPCVMMDVLPTVLSAVTDPHDGSQEPRHGVTVNPDVDGVDLLDLLREGEGGPSRPIYWEYQGQLAVRDGKWKWTGKPIERLGATSVLDRQLVDLTSDTGETTDVSDVFPDVADRLERQARQWAIEVGV